MNIKIEHQLSADKVLACSKTLIDSLKEEHSDRITHLVQIWNENESNFSFRLSGFNIEGKLIVNKDNIEITGTLPLAAMLFKKMIEETIRNHAEKMLKECKEGKK